MTISSIFADWETDIKQNNEAYAEQLRRDQQREDQMVEQAMENYYEEKYGY